MEKTLSQGRWTAWRSEGGGGGEARKQMSPQSPTRGKAAQPCRQVDFSPDSGRSSNLQNFKIINVFKPLNPWQFAMPANETNKQKNQYKSPPPSYYLFFWYTHIIVVSSVIETNFPICMPGSKKKETRESKKVVISKMVIHIYSFLKPSVCCTDRETPSSPLAISFKTFPAYSSK